MAVAPRSAIDLLTDLSLFRGVDAACLNRLADESELRKTSRHTELFLEGTPAEGLWLIRTGEVKVVKQSGDGREQIVYLARPGRVIAAGINFEGGSYPASAIAMRSASAILLSNSLIAAEGMRSPEILLRLLNLRSRREDRLLELVSDLSLRTVPARLASFICRLVTIRESKGQDSRNLVRDLTTETVAGRLGTVREEISRGLAFLEKQGALRVSTDFIEVVDFQKLEDISTGSKKDS